LRLKVHRASARARSPQSSLIACTQGTLADICRNITLLTGAQSLSAVRADAKLDALRAHLAKRRTVLLLDNLEIASQTPDDPLWQLMRTVPAGSLVIASISGSHPLESASRVALDELGLADVCLLIGHEARRLGLVAPEVFDLAFAGRLQRAVGGNPKLIESFLRGVAASPDPIADLIEALERGEGLEELFGRVWDKLSPEARTVAVACAYLRGDGLAAQMRVASQLGSEALSRALAELIRVGLVGVVRGVDRPEIYRCSVAVQRFTLVVAAKEEIASFTDRLSAFYVRQLISEPENASWAVPHIAGIKAVLQWLSDRGDDVGVQELFASLLDVLFTLGLFDDRIITGRLAYDSAIRAGNHRAASLATDVLSSTYAARGEHAKAREALALGLIAAERSQDDGERARQMRAHGLTLYKAGDAAAALAALHGADALARETGDLEIVVNVLGVRGVACWYQGDLAGAEAAAQAGLSVCEEMRWQRAAAYPLRNLAELAVRVGKYERAQGLLDRAAEIAEGYGDQRQMARIHLTGARLALFRGQLAACSVELLTAELAAKRLGLGPELHELAAMRRAAMRARWLPPVRLWYAYRRPQRFSDAPVGGD
jgi:tetratricopeptide (TPR) repeat protein